MKKCIGIALAVLMVIGFSGMAVAEHGGFVPAKGTVETGHDTMYSGPGAYVKMSSPFLYSCNGKFVIPCTGKTGVDVDFVFNASVAQWLQLKVSATQVDWKVIKPGKYSMPKPIMFGYRSNGDLTLKFRDFTDLTGTDGDVIETKFKYMVLPDESTFSPWYSKDEVNGCEILVPEVQTHVWKTVKMKMKIVVEDCDSACEYTGSGTIRVILDEQKPWLSHLLKLEKA